MTRTRWIGVLCVGLMLATVGGVLGALRVAGTFTATDHEVPGVFVEELEVGPHVVFEQIGGSSRVGSVSVTRTGFQSVTDVRIVGPLGDSVPVDLDPTSQTLTINNRIYVGVAQFDADVDGEYRVEVDSSESAVVRVGLSVFGIFGRILVPLALLLPGGAMVVLSAIMLFLGRSRGGSDGGGPHPVQEQWSPQQTPPAPPPPPHVQVASPPPPPLPR